MNTQASVDIAIPGNYE